MPKFNKLFLRQKQKEATEELADLNREMALKMIVLACDTGDIDPLIDAVQAMRSTEELYSQSSTPIENAHIQKKLGDVLLSVGKNEVDMRALEHAILAYRSAITIASLLGAEGLREDIRINYKEALRYAGQDEAPATFSLMGVA
ncbi:MAG: hypothetical protein COA43_09450 [Robiginitomaculum sp.]|nr:MAG: hypothetical protein COA43_09450 [Robiginitomaculum sp.]